MTEDRSGRGLSEVSPISAFRDFHLRVARNGLGRPTVHVINSPVGCTDPCGFTIPRVIEELYSICSRTSRAKRDTQPETQPPPSAQLSVHDRTRLQEAGTQLFQLLMGGAVGDRYRASWEQCPKDVGLRVRLSFDVDREDHELQAIPWEILHDPESGYLCLNRRSPVVRSLSLQGWRGDPAEELPLPLRALVISSGPTDSKKLELDKELQHLRSALGQHGAIEVRVLKSGKELGRAQREVLRQALLEREFHLAHFMGHASEDRLEFLDHNDKRDSVEARIFAPQLWGLPKLRLVVLNACATARGSSNSTLVARLLATGLPAVLGMRCKIADPSAQVFSRSFYRRISAGDSAEAATTEARLALSAEYPNHLDWLIPILFLQGNHGRIFEPPDGPWIDPVGIEEVKKVTGIPFTLVGRALAVAATMLTRRQWAQWQDPQPRDGDHSPQVGIDTGEIRRTLKKINEKLREESATAHLYVDFPSHPEWQRAVQQMEGRSLVRTDPYTKPLVAGDLDLALGLSMWCRRSSDSGSFGASTVRTDRNDRVTATFQEWTPGCGHEKLGFRPVLRLLGETHDRED